jgi:hypothetical protein
MADTPSDDELTVHNAPQDFRRRFTLALLAFHVASDAGLLAGKPFGSGQVRFHVGAFRVLE